MTLVYVLYALLLVVCIIIAALGVILVTVVFGTMLGWLLSIPVRLWRALKI